MTSAPKLYMRHATFARALKGAVAMQAKYGTRFAVRGDHLVAGYGWALVEVVEVAR